MLVYILQGIGYGFSGAVQPGPFQTYIISQSLRQGWRRTLPAALSPLISDGPIIVLALLLLSQLPAGWKRVLYIVGGVFVLSLAWGAYRAWRDFDLTVPVPDADVNTAGVLEAALMNALSPGPYLYWGLVTGPILLSAWREAPSHGVGFLAGFYGAMVGGLVGIIALFGTARRLGPRVTRWLVGISALALAVFGIYQIWQGVRG
ncbi:MAG: LysE family transporter [Anaerolineae bacterium]|nr:LysE family transporter [Anaerolineae bacterium]